MQNSQLANDIRDIKERIKCRCLIECPDGSDNSTCLLQSNAKCFKKLFINEFGEEEVRAGCLGSLDDQIDQCNKLANPQFRVNTDLQCCNNGSMCNDHLVMKLPTQHSPPEDDATYFAGENLNMLIVLTVSVLSLCIIFGTIITLYSIRVRRRERRRKQQIKIENLRAGYPVLYPRSSHGKGKKGCMAVDLNELPSLTATSSGSGMPLLVQRTISKQIEIVKEVGKGRCGSVMLGRWRDEYVALKIFDSRHEENWYRETEIYQTVMLRHENILGFIAADISGANSWTQLYLITDYHANGSLFDYLHRHVLNVADALRFALTACSGLAHLHTEITGTQGKPAIAHRDVKSKNILVKNDGQCCIADMGLAVRYSRQQGKVDLGSYENSKRRGTLRYMAPEVIRQLFHPDSFAPYKAADVYGFALVMWEIANRTRVKGIVNSYHPPYYDAMSDDPDLREVDKVVVIEKVRPEILPEWLSHEVMSSYVSTMQECWLHRYESRLSMLRVRKTLSSLFNDGRKVVIESSGSDSDRKLPIQPTNAGSSTSDASSFREPPLQISTFDV